MFFCAQCSYQGDFAFQLDHHIGKIHHNAAEPPRHIFEGLEMFVCIHCDYKSHYKLKLYEHYEHAHIAIGNKGRHFNWYKCQCNFKSYFIASLVKHVETCEVTECSQRTDHTYARVLEDPSEDALRSQSWEMTEWNRNLARYMWEHDVEMPWMNCAHCSFRSKYRSNLCRHIKLRHGNGSGALKWHVCAHCSYETTDRGLLNRHMVVHAPPDAIKWYVCTRCPYKAKRKQGLAQHMLRHAAKKQIDWHRCDQCSYKTKLKSNLETHVTRHATSEAQWYNCTKCSYKGKFQSHLNRHVLSCSVLRATAFKRVSPRRSDFAHI